MTSSPPPPYSPLPCSQSVRHTACSRRSCGHSFSSRSAPPWDLEENDMRSVNAWKTLRYFKPNVYKSHRSPPFDKLKSYVKYNHLPLWSCLSLHYNILLTSAVPWKLANGSVGPQLPGFPRLCGPRVTESWVNPILRWIIYGNGITQYGD